MLIEEIIKKIHRKFSKDTDYPEAGSEDLLVYLDHIDDAISEWESSVFEGYPLKELQTSGSLTLGGSGSDSLPSDFLAFLPKFDIKSGGFSKATLKIGNAIFSEVSPGEGGRRSQVGIDGNVFWKEGSNIRTLPAVSGTIDFPYLKKATRFTVGTETIEPEMEDPKFIEDFALAKIFLDNADDTLYQSNIASASERLDRMKDNALI